MGALVNRRITVVELEAALPRAAAEVGPRLLSGRGHAPRATLRGGGPLASAAARLAPFESVSPGKRCKPRRMFSLEVLRRCAEILGVEADNLIGKVYE
jgi:hypothetical protein